MSSFARLRARHAAEGGPLRILSASGQLGYAIPRPSLAAGLARQPHVIGADMGSVDPGPAYLGSGRMAPDADIARADLRLVLLGARELDVPLVIGSAGTAGATPHLDETIALLSEIARAHGLRFRLAAIRADVAPETILAAEAEGRLHPIGPMPTPAPDEIRRSRIVAQMGTEPFAQALEAGADVVVAGRACDTAIFSTIPILLGFDPGPTTHMAKIVECTSLCCEPGGRDAMLATLDEDGFVLESMNPARRATPVSVAAHALYEQSDPFSVAEPEGTLRLEGATYEAVDGRRTRVRGARFEPAARTVVKVEGALREGERAVLLAASADPAFIAALPDILPEVEATARALIPGPFRLFPRVYGGGAGVAFWPGCVSTPLEVFLLVECVAETAARARAALSVLRQHLLHHGFPGRLSTAGNLAFPLAPPELEAGPAYRFSLYHLMEVDDAAPLFPIELHELT